MPKLLYTTMPEGYPVCIHTDCPLADSCLHQLAYTPQSEKERIMRMVNPTLCSKTEDCGFYRSNATQRYARGFTSFQPKMLPGQWDAFVRILRIVWGRTSFYQRRRGEIAMPPAEQLFVLDALKKAGVTDVFEFDSYEDLLTWYD